MARPKLKDADLPDTFWKEAMHTACFIANRLPTMGTTRTIGGVAELRTKSVFECSDVRCGSM